MKLIVIFGLIVVVFIITFSVVFSQAIFLGVDNETQFTHPGETIVPYETVFSFTVAIAIIIIVGIILLAFGLFY